MSVSRGEGPPTPGQVTRLKVELLAGSWGSNAQARARRRKSAWNLLLPLLGFPLLVALWFGFVVLAHDVHALLRGSHESLRVFMGGAMHTSSFLVLMPSLLAAVAPAFLITNFLVYLVPPARRAMDAEDLAFPGTEYAASQSALFRMALWLTAFWVVTTLVACVFP